MVESQTGACVWGMQVQPHNWGIMRWSKMDLEMHVGPFWDRNWNQNWRMPIQMTRHFSPPSCFLSLFSMPFFSDIPIEAAKLIAFFACKFLYNKNHIKFSNPFSLIFLYLCHLVSKTLKAFKYITWSTLLENLCFIFYHFFPWLSRKLIIVHAFAFSFQLLGFVKPVDRWLSNFQAHTYCQWWN